MEDSALSARIKARGLCPPAEDVAPAPGVVWDGRAMHMGTKSGSTIRPNFTYRSGEKMVGFVEQPCTETCKLISGDYRAINCPDITKTGEAWKPGNRYTATV